MTDSKSIEEHFIPKGILEIVGEDWKSWRQDKFNTVLELVQHYRDQRTKDIAKLSYHLGVDVKTLEGYLKAKD